MGEKYLKTKSFISALYRPFGKELFQECWYLTFYTLLKGQVRSSSLPPLINNPFTHRPAPTCLAPLPSA